MSDNSDDNDTSDISEDGIDFLNDHLIDIFTSHQISGMMDFMNDSAIGNSNRIVEVDDDGNEIPQEDNYLMEESSEDIHTDNDSDLSIIEDIEIMNIHDSDKGFK